MGKPCRGELIAIEGGHGKVEFMFNPTEYIISKTNDWTTKANKGRNVPKYEFAGGKPRTLQLELFFDTSLSRANTPKQDLRKTLNTLFNLMMIDKDAKTKGQNSGMSRPPKLRLKWGENTPYLAFDCYLTSCSVKHLMFDQAGVPIRATATLTLLEARDKEDLLPTNPTSLGEPGRRLRTVAEGDRLDLIAYEEYGDPREWSRIADTNHLSNPLELQSGTILVIPPR